MIEMLQPCIHLIAVWYHGRYGILQLNITWLGHSNWIISFPLLDVTTSMRAGGLLLLSYYSPDI